jgi:hypothetical protein
VCAVSVFTAVEFTGSSVISYSRINRYNLIIPAVEFTCASDVSCSIINRYSVIFPAVEFTRTT